MNTVLIHLTAWEWMRGGIYLCLGWQTWMTGAYLLAAITKYITYKVNNGNNRTTSIKGI